MIVLEGAKERLFIYFNVNKRNKDKSLIFIWLGTKIKIDSQIMGRIINGTNQVWDSNLIGSLVLPV